ncbi:MAG: MarR family transcriptional regulator [Candidatus Melainabacteria bacterium HGW-Melainabacteria-1]|nr:MAG: MarR family transcriptional regulator [Candidatus Melainabacteria bacterium HGW-Melainabacteria-1]
MPAQLNENELADPELAAEPPDNSSNSQVLLAEVRPLRQASREMVRELGFMQTIYTPADMPHSHCHALMETELSGPLSQNELSERLRLDKSTASRIIAQLIEQDLLLAETDPDDKRRRLIRLSEAGRERLQRVHADADARVQAALTQLDPIERGIVLQGMQLYARALNRARQQSAYTIRPIQPEDAPGVARVIRQVMPEFGARGPGFALSDAEVDDMYRAYSQPGTAYFVIRAGHRVLGGGGIAPLDQGDSNTCELRKMYFLPELRGLGLGQQLIQLCLQAAASKGYRRVYLETLQSMRQARALYAKNGFQALEQPLGDTGHFSCDAWYLKDLESPLSRESLENLANCSDQTAS